MTSKVRLSFIKTASYYSLANIFLSGLTFSLIPVMTRFLEVGELGRIFLFQATMTLCFVIVGLGSQSVLQSYFFKDRDSFPTYLSAALFNSIAVVLVLLVVIALFGDYLLALIRLEKKYAYAALLVSLLFYFKSLCQMLYQAEGNAKRYLIAFCSSGLIGWLFSAVVLAFVFQDWLVRIYGISIELALISIFFFSLCYKYRLHFPELNKIKELFWVGSPVIFHSCSMLLINQTDRFLLSALMGENEVGVYGVSAQLASAIGLFGGTLAMAYNPIFYQRMSSGKAKDLASIKKIRKVCLLMNVGCLLMVAFAIKSFSKEILGESFELHHGSFYILAFSNMLFAFYHLYSGYFYHYKKTKTLALITTSIAITNVVVSYLMIPHWGLYGAAAGTFLAFFCGFVGAYAFSAYTRSRRPSGAFQLG